jgi:hypothetical protein
MIIIDLTCRERGEKQRAKQCREWINSRLVFGMAQQFTNRSAFTSRGRRWLHEQGGLGIGKHCGLIANRMRR